jgi:glycine/D-amino acid oxidase-like deaminating enzyme
MSDRRANIAVIGGGFFGCCLALFLRSVFDDVVLIESEAELLTRASRINQARVHTGFHYPRSFVTALRSRALQARFVADFKTAIVDDFQMLYAVARRRSKVSADRFYRMFSTMDAPIRPATRAQRGLFNMTLIDDVYQCQEFAFDWTFLRDHVLGRLTRHGIHLVLGKTVSTIESTSDGVRLMLDGGRTVEAGTAFNVTYANINSILLSSGLQPLDVKLELAELALIVPPADFARLGVTVMDGPFFSAMPYPSANLHSFTHVRYTPHYSWVDRPGGRSAYAVGNDLQKNSRWRHMMLDSARFVPCFADLDYKSSLFDVKAVLVRNERNDGRPILLHRHRDAPRLFSVMGAKIDNIYDLFDALPEADPQWRNADARFLLG